MLEKQMTGKKVLCAALFLVASLTALAMPTQKEIDRAEQVVETILSDSRSSLKAGELTHAAFADLCVSFSEKTESDAVEYLLLERAFSHYVKAGEYESAERTLESLMSEIRNVPPSTLVRLLDKSVPSSVRKDVPWFGRVKKAAKTIAKNRDRLSDMVKAVKRQPTNPNAMRQLGLCYARVGIWTKALAAFARAGGELAAMARAEVARSKPLNEIADFWRDLDRDEIGYQVHAATLYQDMLENSETSDLMKAYAEKCLERIESDEAVGAYRLVLGGAVAGTSSSAAKYCVIDLSAGPDALCYPVAYLCSQPADGFNTDEYKTKKLVLKRVEAGTFIMGRDQEDESHRVTLTKPFYMGLFEVTQKQWELVMGTNPSRFEDMPVSPVEQVSYDMIRGRDSGGKWPESNGVDDASFLGRLRKKTRIDFDLPTEAQWEYACRAKSKFFDPAENAEHMWYVGNSSRTSHMVGTKKPNNWGFYDMYGNVWEWCLDWDGNRAYGKDPQGASWGRNRVFCGVSWSNPHSDHDQSFVRCRHRISPDGSTDDIGFRLCRTIEKK